MAVGLKSISDASERVGRLLGSQREFFVYPQPKDVDPLKPTTVFMQSLTGGWGCGKTRIGLLKGLFLSAAFPFNEGMVGRYHGKDLEESVIPLFFEVCPESWIRRIVNRGKTGMIVYLVNGSVIYFRHIHDAGQAATKTRRVGANLGWFLLDQGEEITIDHFNSMMGRLRNPKAGIKLGMITANPNGRDWNQKLFFPHWEPLDPENGVFFRVYRRGNLQGVHVDSEENRLMNDGFVSDDFFDNMISNMTPDWVNRYIHGSFEDFSGKVFKGYTPESVHNIDDIPIPDHWDCVGGIDVGGSCPWCVLPVYSDEQGNLIITPGFHKATGRTGEVGDWIKTNMPWNSNRTTFVIDPENKVAQVELADLGIYSRIAEKSVHPGMLRSVGYFHLREKTAPPQWFLDTQPDYMIQRILREGCPRVFIFKSAHVVRREFDNCIWDEKIANQIKKTTSERMDVIDAFRYVAMSLPEPSKRPPDDKYAKLRAMDPVSAKEAEAFDRRIQGYMDNQRGRALREAFYDVDGPVEEYVGRGKWDFNVD